MCLSLHLHGLVFYASIYDRQDQPVCKLAQIVPSPRAQRDPREEKRGTKPRDSPFRVYYFCVPISVTDTIVHLDDTPAHISEIPTLPFRLFDVAPALNEDQKALGLRPPIESSGLVPPRRRELCHPGWFQKRTQKPGTFSRLTIRKV